MILYMPLIRALFFKSATDDQYIGFDSNALVMVDQLNAKDFHKIEDSTNKTHNIIRIDAEKNIYSDGSNKLSVGSKSTAFGLFLSEKGSFLIQNEGMCLGYYTGSKNIELRECSEHSFNSGFVLVGSLNDQAKEVRMKVGTRKPYTGSQTGNAFRHDFKQIGPQDLETLVKPFRRDASPATELEGGIDVAREFVKFNVF